MQEQEPEQSPPKPRFRSVASKIADPLRHLHSHPENLEKKPPQLKWPFSWTILPLFWRARKHPEALKQLIQLLESAGATEKDIALIKEMHSATREALNDIAWFRIDRYLVGGIGIVDLILLQVILPMGTLDTPLFVALLALVVSLPLAAGSLFFTFLKDKGRITTYGRIHSWLSLLPLSTGAVALTASIWHVSRLGGIVFLCLAIAVYALCYGYAVIFVFEKHSVHKFLELVKIAKLSVNTPTSNNGKQ